MRLRSSIGSALARHTGEEEITVTLHILQQLSVALVKGNAAILNKQNQVIAPRSTRALVVKRDSVWEVYLIFIDCKIWLNLSNIVYDSLIAIPINPLILQKCSSPILPLFGCMPSRLWSLNCILIVSVVPVTRTLPGATSVRTGQEAGEGKNWISISSYICCSYICCSWTDFLSYIAPGFTSSCARDMNEICGMLREKRAEANRQNNKKTFNLNILGTTMIKMKLSSKGISLEERCKSQCF